MNITKEKKSKISLTEFTNILSVLYSKNWVVTVIFFLAAFIAALYVWWQSIQVDTPRPQVLNEFNQNKEDFEQMSRKVSGAIKQLQERKGEFEHAKDYSGQREMFRTWNQQTSDEQQEAAKDPTAATQPDQSQPAAVSGQEQAQPATTPRQDNKEPVQPAGQLTPATVSQPGQPDGERPGPSDQPVNIVQ